MLADINTFTEGVIFIQRAIKSALHANIARKEDMRSILHSKIIMIIGDQEESVSSKKIKVKGKAAAAAKRTQQLGDNCKELS